MVPELVLLSHSSICQMGEIAPNCNKWLGGKTNQELEHDAGDDDDDDDEEALNSAVFWSPAWRGIP